MYNISSDEGIHIILSFKLKDNVMALKLGELSGRYAQFPPPPNHQTIEY